MGLADPIPGALSANVKSADRVLDVFELLARQKSGCTHSEISDALGIPRSSLTVLLRNLMQREYLRYDALSKTYCLGPRFTFLARRMVQLQDLVTVVEPLLADITAATGETSALNLLDGRHSRVAASVESPHRLVYNMRTGDGAPLYATSGGKAMLAHFDAAQLADYFAETALVAITPRTIVSETDLRKQLDAIRAGAIAEVFDEYTLGIVGLATPILSGADELLGAISLAIPSQRYGPEARARAEKALANARSVLRREFSG